VRWPWQRRGVSATEVRESKQHLQDVQATELQVDATIRIRQGIKNRNGFASLIEEGLKRGRGE
jgi:hypothetical protein